MLWAESEYGRESVALASMLECPGEESNMSELGEGGVLERWQELTKPDPVQVLRDSRDTRHKEAGYKVKRGPIVEDNHGETEISLQKTTCKFIGTNPDLAGLKTQIMIHGSDRAIPGIRNSQTVDFQAKFLNSRGSTFVERGSPSN